MSLPVSSRHLRLEMTRRLITPNSIERAAGVTQATIDKPRGGGSFGQGFSRELTDRLQPLFPLWIPIQRHPGASTVT